MDAQFGLIDLVALIGAATILGTACYLARGLFNPFPDRLSDSAVLDAFVSGDYSSGDHVLGVAFDDNGYYRTDSLHNLRLTIGFAILATLVALFTVPEAPTFWAMVVDGAGAWLCQRVHDRLMVPLGLGA